MTREKQKQSEALYAANLSKDMSYGWIVDVPFNEDDWPDLMITTSSNDKFGLEVRDMYVDDSSKGSIEKGNESFRHKLLKKLSVEYYAKRGVPILLDIRGPFYNESVGKILDYLLSVKLQEWVHTEHDIIIHNKKTRLFIERLPSDFGQYCYWKCMDDNIGWVERITEDKIEKIVKEKSIHIDKYRKNVSNVSLLIVANRIYNSGKMLLEKSREINTCGFDKVYFYMHPIKVVVYDGY